MLNKLEYKIEKIGGYVCVKLFKNSRMVVMNSISVNGLYEHLSKKSRDIFVGGVLIKREKYDCYKKLSISNLDTRLTIEENLVKYDILLVDHEELLDVFFDIKTDLENI